MNRIKINNNAFVYPMPMTIVGAEVNGKANFMAVAWVTRVCYQPPLIAVSLNKAHYTNAGVHEHKCFSVCIPDINLMEKTDYSGIVSGKKTDKSALFTVFKGETTGAPMIDECPLCMECKVHSVVDFPTNELFIGEIVGAYIKEEFITDGKPDIKKMNPFVLTMPDNFYWSVGEQLGKGWSIGKNLIK